MGSDAHRRPKKGLVDNSLVLRVRDVVAALERRPGDGPAWLNVRRPDGRGEPLSVRFDVVDVAGRDAVRLSYERAGEELRYVIRVATLPQHFGGYRLLWHCPLVGANDTPCRRSIRDLYLPPSQRYFGCRWSHDLTYRSMQAPAVSRLERFAATLDGYLADLGSPDARRKVVALVGARRAVASFLDGLRSARPNGES